MRYALKFDFCREQIGMVMIVSSHNARKRSFFGVDLLLLSYGNESMITKMLYKKVDKVPFHRHPNEQSIYMISGRHRITIDGSTCEIWLWDSYTIPHDAEHGIEILESGEVLDCFSPPRKDYL